MPELESERRVVGVRQTTRALRAQRVARVFLAQDADPAVTGPIEALCRAQSVEAVWFASMQELGRHCGIAVKAAAAADVRPAP